MNVGNNILGQFQGIVIIIPILPMHTYMSHQKDAELDVHGVLSEMIVLMWQELGFQSVNKERVQKMHFYKAKNKLSEANTGIADVVM